MVCEVHLLYIDSETNYFTILQSQYENFKVGSEWQQFEFAVKFDLSLSKLTKIKIVQRTNRVIYASDEKYKKKYALFKKFHKFFYSFFFSKEIIGHMYISHILLT